MGSPGRRRRLGRRGVRALLAGTVTAALMAVPAQGAQPATVLVSAVPSGASADDGATFGRPQWSANGRVVFSSASSRLVPGDTNGHRDVFVRDLATGETTLVSVGMNGQLGNNDSDGASMSADGRYVAFGSLASNLVPGDTNGFSDVFVRDLQSGVTTRVSVPVGGGQASGHSAFGSPATISADGREVAFSSTAKNLVSAKPDFTRDVYVADLSTGTLRRVSIPQAGGWANGASDAASVSGDGRFVVFQSVASNLVANDGNGAQDVFVRDLDAGTTTLVSHTPTGGSGNGASAAGLPGITPDGKVIVLTSAASNLVPNDTNQAADAYVYQRVSGTFTLASVGIGGAPAQGASADVTVSADGDRVAFTSLAANLVPDDTNATGDVFVRHLRAGATERASTALGGGDSNGVSQLPSVSPDGSMVAFASRASNLVAGDGSGWDVFAHSLSVDADPPAIVCAQADGAWHDANVTLACTAVDTGSGLADPSDATFTLPTSVSPGVETTDAATNSRVVCDVSGNCATAGPVRGNRIDLRAPATACAGGDGGWHAGNVSIACAASDAGSGLAHGDDSAFVLSTSVPDGQESADAATSDRAVCDAVGNCTQAGPIGGNRVDRRAPSIAIAAPADGAAYVLGGVAAASYSCADGGSGVATCTGPARLDTAMVGYHELTVTATDAVGNRSSRSAGYWVRYAWSGFFGRPLIHVEAGRAIPLRFSLGGAFGLGAVADGYPRSVGVACGSGAAPEAGEPAESVGGGLRYEAAPGRYRYVWKTDRAWSGTCRQLVVRLDDGSTHRLSVRFD